MNLKPLLFSPCTRSSLLFIWANIRVTFSLKLCSTPNFLALMNLTTKRLNRRTRQNNHRNRGLTMQRKVKEILLLYRRFARTCVPLYLHLRSFNKLRGWDKITLLGHNLCRSGFTWFAFILLLLYFCCGIEPPSAILPRTVFMSNICPLPCTAVVSFFSHYVSHAPPP